MDLDSQKLNQFSGRLLSAFLTLADSEQFKLAAERFHVSQSAFSQMIARLESQLGTRLFDRGTRLVSLTPDGHMLVPIARDLAVRVGTMYADLQDHVERRKGKVKFAALPSLSSHWLPKLLAGFRERYPGIKAQLFDASADGSLELVRQGVVDFALSARVSSREEFDTHPLFDEPLFFICPPDHAFANRKSLPIAALNGCQYIHTTRSGSVWRTVEPQLRGIELVDAGFEVDHLGTLAGLIANGAGVSIAAGFALDQFYHAGLRAVRFKEPELRRTLLVVKRRGASLSVSAKALLEMIDANPPKHAMRVGRRAGR